MGLPFEVMGVGESKMEMANVALWSAKMHIAYIYSVGWVGLHIAPSRDIQCFIQILREYAEVLPNNSQHFKLVQVKSYASSLVSSSYIKLY